MSPQLFIQNPNFILSRVSFTAANHNRNGVSSNVNIMIRRGFATAAGNLKMNRRNGYFVTFSPKKPKALSPKETTTYTSLIDSLCKQDRFDDAYNVLNEMFDSGFSPPFDTFKVILRGFLRIGEIRKAFDLYNKMYEPCYRGFLPIGHMNKDFHLGNMMSEHLFDRPVDFDIESLLNQALSNEVTYTSLMNAYLDEGNWDNAQDLYHHIQQCSLPDSVIYSVIINGLDNKARTIQIRKELLKLNYLNYYYLDRPILEYHRTMVENSNIGDDDDEFKSVVELVEGICIKGLENVFDILLKSNYKPEGIDDGIVYNLFIIAHCKHYNVDEAYIMYKDMVHYGYACHMFTVFALIQTLYRKYMVNELRWVIQNVLRSCNLDDSEIVKFLDEFNPKKPEALLGDTEYDIEDDTETLLDDTKYDTKDDTEALLDDTEYDTEDDDTEEDDTEDDDTEDDTEALLDDTEALLDDTEAFLNDTKALFDVLAEKAKDGLFLECSYAPTKAEELSHADRTRQVVRSSPNKTTYTCLIDAFCKQDRFDVAYRVLNEMIISGFSPSLVTVNDVLCGFLRIGDMRTAFEMYTKMNEHFFESWIDHETHLLLLQGLSDEVTYTSLINAYLDEGKCDDAENLYCEMARLDKFLHQNEITHICSLPDSVIYSVFINGLDNKARTTEVNKYLLRFNYGSYMISAYRPILEYHFTLAENCSDDEFKSLVELVDGFCNRGLENAYDTMLKSNYKPDGIDDGIVYNLFVIAHCQRHNIDEAYNMYTEMVHCGFACHMFTMFALVATLYNELQLNGFNKKRKNCKDIVNQLLWIIQNVLRSCNLNDSEIVNFLNEFNPEKPISEALFYVLAEKAKDGMFLKCSYSPPSA